MRHIEQRRDDLRRTHGFVAGLRAELGITESQSEAWAVYVAALGSNRERMERTASKDSPFGTTTERLANLAGMRQATSQLHARLTAAQRDRAIAVLPLCCQPVTPAAAA
jgi:hypothetical protein